MRVIAGLCADAIHISLCSSASSLVVTNVTDFVLVIAVASVVSMSTSSVWPWSCSANLVDTIVDMDVNVGIVEVVVVVAFGWMVVGILIVVTVGVVVVVGGARRHCRRRHCSDVCVPYCTLHECHRSNKCRRSRRTRFGNNINMCTDCLHNSQSVRPPT